MGYFVLSVTIVVLLAVIFRARNSYDQNILDAMKAVNDLCLKESVSIRITNEAGVHTVELFARDGINMLHFIYKSNELHVAVFKVIKLYEENRLPPGNY